MTDLRKLGGYAMAGAAGMGIGITAAVVIGFSALVLAAPEPPDIAATERVLDLCERIVGEQQGGPGR